MLNRIVATIASVALLVSTTTAYAAQMGYMKIKGQKSGEVKGSNTQKGHEGTIGVIASSHEIVSPRDAASGLATGKRMHKPFFITKEVDKSSPLLYKMIATNENLPEVTIQFVRPNAGGIEQVVLTVTLTNASIASIKFVQPDSDKPDTMRLPEREEIGFTYSRIKWTAADGTVAEDSWSATAT